MKIHEYQAKNILKKYGVSVPRGEMVESTEEAEAAAKRLFDEGSTGVVVKAQIHAGGRGKGGGVKIAKSVQEAAELAGKILGMTLVTHQDWTRRPGCADIADRRNFADRERALSGYRD